MLITATLEDFPSIPQVEAQFKIIVGECEITSLTVTSELAKSYQYEIRTVPDLL